jgi:hypothetical protein
MHRAPKPYSAEDMRSAHLARSSFPELGHNTKLSSVDAQSTTDDPHLALQVSTYTKHKASYNHLHLAQLTTDSFLHHLAFYLYITKGPKHG